MASLRRVELLLTTCLVLLKIHVLHDAWGRLQGFDAGPWLDVFHATHWFERLPRPEEFFASYHPPLSYLFCRWIFFVYPHEVEASQILSTLSMLGATFALRSSLRTIGMLWTLPGLSILYVGASIPLIVSLAVETSYDALVFMWFMIALALSKRLFWWRLPAAFWRSPYCLARLTALAIALSAGLLTKFNGLIAFGVPFLVILTRRGFKGVLREGPVAGAAAMCAVIAVSPLYYSRYYKPFGQVFPTAIDWLRANDLKRALALRDSNRWAFILHMVRIPERSITGTQEPIRDSFIHSIWLHTWKLDISVGPQAPFSLAISDLYIRGAPFVLAVAAVVLVVRARRLPVAMRDFGIVLGVIAMTFCAGQLYFAWKYPLWDWGVFKAKYMTPAVLWIAFSVGALVDTWASHRPSAPFWDRFKTDAVLVLVLAFMCTNHLVPVYFCECGPREPAARGRPPVQRTPYALRTPS